MMRRARDRVLYHYSEQSHEVTSARGARSDEFVIGTNASLGPALSQQLQVPLPGGCSTTYYYYYVI